MDLLNKIMVVGNLTRDPEVRETGNGKSVAELSLAIDPPGGAGRSGDGERAGKGSEPIFLDVVLWEGMAENAAKYLKKGSGVLIEGRLQMDTWKDRETGQTRRKLKAVGERMRFLSSGGPRDDRQQDRERAQPPGPRSPRREPAETRR